MDGEPENFVVIYDGECPFCSAYSKRLCIDEKFGNLVLVDARSDDGRGALANLDGCTADEGMVVSTDGKIYHGAAALHLLGLRGTRTNSFGRLNHALFRSMDRSRTIYPWVRAGRNMTLRLLGRKLIGAK